MKEPGLGIGGWGFGLVLVILALIHLPACSPKPASKAPSLFPATNEVAGWAKTGETRTFQAENLWEYIDGDADRYTQAGVETTLTTDYRFQNKIDAVTDIHIMKGPEGPKKLLASEWSAEAQRSPVGEDGRLFPTSLVFVKGRYLVRLVAYEQAPEMSQALVELGRAIESRLAR
ncbi:MAG: hypothetical protein LAO07_15285 [Acidobacteriia bacterium]|nr:hypothetical protein [Terriglobia bacterium]